MCICIYNVFIYIYVHTVHIFLTAPWPGMGWCFLALRMDSVRGIVTSQQEATLRAPVPMCKYALTKKTCAFQLFVILILGIVSLDVSLEDYFMQITYPVLPANSSLCQLQRT